MSSSADTCIERSSYDSHDSSISAPSATSIEIDRACGSASPALSVSVASERTGHNPPSGNYHEEADEYTEISLIPACRDDCRPLSVEETIRDDLSQTQSDDAKTLTDSFVVPLGVVNLSIVLLSIILSLVILGFLTFLWASEGSVPGGEEASMAWRYLVIKGWLFQVVAVSSTILRFTLSVQLPLTTCLVAALILERRAVPISISAALSIYRGINGGPPTLLHLLWSRKLFRIIFTTPEMILLSIIAAATIVMQFSSTLLLSDIREGLIIDLPRDIRTNNAGSITGVPQDAFANALQKPLSKFPVFGEVPSNISVHNNGNGLRTAGTKRHGFLPGGNSDQSVRSFNGGVFTLASEISCVPPIIEDMTLVSYFNNNTHNNHGNLVGKIDYEETMNRASIRPQSENWSARLPQAFSCSVATGHRGQPGTTMCILNSPGNLWPTWNDTDDIWKYQSQVMLAFQNRYDLNITGDSGETFAPTEVTPTDENAYDEWRQFNLHETTLEVSMCFLRWNMKYTTARLSTNIHLERLPLPDGNMDIISSFDYDGQDVRETLGATLGLQNLADRRVMNVSSDEVESDGWYTQPEVDLMDAVMTSLGSQDLRTNTSISLCESGDNYSETSLSPGLLAVFCDIGRHTRSAPLLLQTLIKVAGQSIYTQLEDSFTLGDYALVVHEITRNKPVRCAGLISVAVLVSVSSLCIVIIMRLYMRYIRFTKIDNFWYTISQLVSEDTADTIMRSNLSPDEYVFRDREGAEDHLIRLQLSEETGRVEIVRVEQP